MKKFEFVVTKSRSGGYENNFNLVFSEGVTLIDFLKWYRSKYNNKFTIKIVEFDTTEHKIDVDDDGKGNVQLDSNLLAVYISKGFAFGTDPTSITIELCNNAEDSISIITNKIRKLCSEAEMYEKIIATLDKCDIIHFKENYNEFLTLDSDSELSEELLKTTSIYYEGKLKQLRDRLTKIEL